MSNQIILRESLKEYEFLHRCFIIDVIVSSDNITMNNVLKDPSIGLRGQVMKLSKVKLDEEITVPSFLTDPSHHVKVVSKRIFSIFDNGKAQLCGFT